MKQRDCYDASVSKYARNSWRKIHKPAITVKRAREILLAARAKIKDMSAPNHRNRGLSHEQAIEILSHGIGPSVPESEILAPLYSGNIVRSYGRYL